MTGSLPFGPAYGFGAYLHWPYCARICPYCDFNVYAAKDRDNEGLLAAMVTDIDGHGARLEGHPALGSVYLGGGTPSLLSGSEIAHLIEACADAFGLAHGAEITLEANPGTFTPERAKDWRAAGVNRLSIGVQSLDDAALGFLGRDHDALTARRAVATALETFPSVSLDLIYARPGQSLEDWTRELSQALELGAQHVSLYELTIETATPFGKAAARGSLVPMADEAQADLYETTQALMAGAGLPAYEISNHATGETHRSQHNLVYWRSGDWLGIGPGAHGRLTIDSVRRATEAARRPGDYVRAVANTGSGVAIMSPLASLEAAQELLAMGLRTVEGVSLDRLEAAFEGMIDRSGLKDLQDAGWLEPGTDRLVLTPAGRLLADRITGEIEALLG